MIYGGVCPCVSDVFEEKDDQENHDRIKGEISWYLRE
jgi:hypothetical protein